MLRTRTNSTATNLSMTRFTKVGIGERPVSSSHGFPASGHSVCRAAHPQAPTSGSPTCMLMCRSGRCTSHRGCRERLPVERVPSQSTPLPCRLSRGLAARLAPARAPLGGPCRPYRPKTHGKSSRVVQPATRSKVSFPRDQTTR